MSASSAAKQLPDLAEWKQPLIGIYLLRVLGGALQKHPLQHQNALALLARLTDKAKEEYLAVREAIIISEIPEAGDIKPAIDMINNLENCLNSLGRIHKIYKVLDPKHHSSRGKVVADIRNDIEHMDERIIRNVAGNHSLGIPGDEMIASIKMNSIVLVEIADEIFILYQLIKEKLTLFDNQP